MSTTNVTASPGCTTAARRLPNSREMGRSYKALARRLHLLVDEGSDQPLAVGVTSCAPGEGVSTVAGNLAVHSTDVFDGPVLIVDANLERPSLARIFGLSQSPGLAEAMAQSQDLEACIHRSSLERLSVMPSGAVAGRLSRLADITGARRLLTELGRRYEFIVVDLPSTSETDFGLALSEHLRGVLMVVEAERLRTQVIARAKEQFARSPANLLGVVLNKRRMPIPNWLYRRL